jgi:Na+/proline symporter
MAVSIIVTLKLESIGDAWTFLLVIGAGTGPVLLLRWFWWRINAWSEVAANLGATIVSLVLQLGLGWDSKTPRGVAYLMLATVAATTVIWLITTLLTAPEPKEKLIAFYRKVQPEGPGWKPVAAAAGLSTSGGIAIQFVNWLLGCALIYASLFGIGKLIFKEWAAGVVFIVIAVIAAALISRNLSRTDWKGFATEGDDLEAAKSSAAD